MFASYMQLECSIAFMRAPFIAFYLLSLRQDPRTPDLDRDYGDASHEIFPLFERTPFLDT
jgi:hypothetical protein